MTKVEIFKVGSDDEGIRLDRWFKRHYPDLTYAALAKLLRTGQIRLNGKRADPGERITQGAEIRVPPIGAAPRPMREKAEVEALSDKDIAYAKSLVLYKDDAILVLNKPAGLATQGGPGIDIHVDRLSEALKFGLEGRPKLVHRLDKDTSGVLIMGRTAGAASKLAEAFRHRNAQKIYWALVMGVPQKREGKILLALDKRAGPAGDKVEVAEEGKASRTLYRVIDVAGRSAAWLELQPLTGRMHQLRVHCAEGLHHVIVGDGKYGGSQAFLTGGISRKLHLHARSLTIQHPDGTMFSIKAPMPKHMSDSWTMLGFDEAAG